MGIGLGTMYVLTPAVGVSWPALLPIAMLAAARIGYEAVEDPEKFGIPVLDRLKRSLRNQRIVSVPLFDVNVDKDLNVDLMLSEMQVDEQRQWVQGEVTIIFRRDPRGQFHIDAMGPEKLSKKELRDKARAFAENMLQSFATNRVVTELSKIGAEVVEEEKDTNGDLTLKLRRWN